MKLTRVQKLRFLRRVEQIFWVSGAIATSGNISFFCCLGVKVFLARV